MTVSVCDDDDDDVVVVVVMVVNVAFIILHDFITLSNYHIKIFLLFHVIGLWTIVLVDCTVN